MFQVLILQAALTVGQAPNAEPAYQQLLLPSQPAVVPISHVGEPSCTDCPPVVECDECNECEKPKKKWRSLFKKDKGCDECDTCDECKEEAPACDECEEEKCKTWCNRDGFDLGESLFGEKSNWDLGGWVTTGYHSDNTGTPGGAPGVAGTMFNNQQDRVNLHQAWLYLEKVADGKCGFDWGFRADVVYGIDAVDTQAFGGSPGRWDFMNGWGSGDREAFALPQVYVDVALGEDLLIRGGKFFTLIGYETVAAQPNFFYSHAFTFWFSEPFTHTGVYATYTGIEDLTLYGGWVAGNDTGFESFNGGSAYLGGFSADITENVTFGYIANVGDLGKNGNGFHGTALLTVQLTEKLQYVLQNDWAHHDNGISPGPLRGPNLPGNSFDSLALVNYLFYDINDCVRLGSRFEWINFEGVDYYDVTAGLNISPLPNLRIRPEYRYQWSPGADNGGFNPLGVPVDDQHIFGIDAVLTF